MDSLIQERELYLMRANSYLQSNMYSEALQNYEKVKSLLQLDEVDFELHRLKCLDGISWTKARMEKYEESLKDCNELIAYAYSKRLLLPKFFTVRGCCYRELGYIILAERDFQLTNNQFLINAILDEEGDESFPTGFTAIGYNAIGNRYFAHNDYEKALDNYMKALQINTEYARANYNIGVIYDNLNQQNISLDYYTKCIRLEPSFVDAYVNRGNSYCALGDWNKGLNDFDMALTIDPSNETAINNKLVILSLLSDKTFYAL